MSSPAILVIGASGNVGSVLINELAPDHEARLLRLVAATGRPEVAGPLRECGIEVRHVDMDDGDVAAVAAAALRDPAAHGGRAYHVAAESASVTEIAGALSEITGQPWRYGRAEPQVFYNQLVAGGFDSIYMRGVRDYMERVGKGSLADPVGVYDTIETVAGRPATSVRQFLQRHRDLFQR